MRPLLAPDSATTQVPDAQRVVSTAARPGLLRADGLAAGAVVIDAGCFNPGGQGDVDTSTGVEHPRALAPVSGCDRSDDGVHAGAASDRNCRSRVLYYLNVTVHVLAAILWLGGELVEEAERDDRGGEIVALRQKDPN